MNRIKYASSSCVSLCWAAVAVSFLFTGCASQPALAQASVSISFDGTLDTVDGVNGQFKLAMSTAFQDGSWSYNFFDTYTGTKESGLSALNPTFTHFQICCDTIPLQDSSTGPYWDFGFVDHLLQPVQQTLPNDPNMEVVIANAPNSMFDANGNLSPSAFADMSTKIVSYYNGNGFDVGGTHYQNTNPNIHRVNYWGIFNEPDAPNALGSNPPPVLTLSNYAAVYNQAAPQMRAIDRSIKLVAGELWTPNQRYKQTDLMNAITAPVDALAVHVYSNCINQVARPPDQSVMNTIPSFYNSVKTLYNTIQSTTLNNWQNVPIWVTENNVNSDSPDANGNSYCNGQPFTRDLRGTSGFFPAYRFGMFVNLGLAGAELLNHWLYNVRNDPGIPVALQIQPQFSEVTTTGTRYISYWTDFYLANWVPAGQNILNMNSSDWDNSDVLGVQSADGTKVTILIANRLVNSSTDNNGPGVARNYVLDLTALGSFTSAKFVTIDRYTASSGPVPRILTPSANMTITLNGYGAAILKLSR